MSRPSDVSHQVEELQQELRRLRKRGSKGGTLWGALYTLCAFVALLVLVSTLFFPVVIIRGSDMSPTLSDGQVVIAVKNAAVRPGDLMLFYQGSTLMVRRCIATSATQIQTDDEGVIYLNGTALDEPYLREKARGTWEISLPYTVPDGCLFALGDNRACAADSRLEAFASIPREQVRGRVFFTLWPPRLLGPVERDEQP